MSVARIQVSLKAAQIASMAVASLASLQVEFPEVRVPVAIGVKILNGTIVLVSTAPKRVNGHSGPKLAVCPTHEEEQTKFAKRSLIHAERSDWEPSSPQEGSRCRALLLEILRRAAHDWVLYRASSRLPNKECAQDAYVWLFEEDTDHPAGKHRATAIFEFDEGDEVGVRTITSFLGICEALDLDPETVRARVKQMDVQTIISAGRPAETRRVKRSDTSGVEEAGLNIRVNMDPMDHQFETQYESYGSVSTPEVLSVHDHGNY